jgi:hypothetical protein
MWLIALLSRIITPRPILSTAQASAPTAQADPTVPVKYQRYDTVSIRDNLKQPNGERNTFTPDAYTLRYVDERNDRMMQANREHSRSCSQHLESDSH